MNRGNRLHQWWQAREPREQWMLAVMCAAMGTFALWFGVVAPLWQWRDAARDRHERAAADLGEIVHGIDTITALQARNPAMTTADAFASAILDSAATARVPVSRQRIDGAGVLEVGIDAVDAPALLGWLDRLRHEHGIAPLMLEISERNGSLQVQARFRPSMP